MLTFQGQNYFFVKGCGSSALLDLSMQDERYAWTHMPRAKELTKGAIDLRLSYQTEVKGDGPPL